MPAIKDIIIIKHIPGHGRAKADSHLELPEINTKEKLLEKDFLPFIKLSHMPLAMIAHIKYSSLDKNLCATYSRVIIDKYIRGKIGFNGILLSDDLCMKALKGPYSNRAKKDAQVIINVASIDSIEQKANEYDDAELIDPVEKSDDEVIVNIDTSPMAEKFND